MCKVKFLFFGCLQKDEGDDQMKNINKLLKDLRPQDINELLLIEK